MKRRINLRFVVAVLALLIVAGAIWFWSAHRGSGTDKELVLYGNVDIRQVQLAFNDSERITELLVREGDRVQAGQKLAILDSRRFEASVASSEANVAAQRESVLKAEADMNVAQANLVNAELSFKRVQDLREKNVVSPQDLDNARAGFDVATATLAAAKQNIAVAKATLKADEAQLELAKRDLANAKLYAPSNGVIQNRLLESGDMASAQKPVFTLALDDPLWVRTYVSETDLGKIREGMKAEVKTDSFPNKRYDGWIGFISPTAEFTPKTVETAEVRTKLVYQVRVFMHNPEGELRLGMPAVVTIPLNQTQK
ncbi:MAG: efflux RND transporter periplasmic adaptor subunit [Chthoniobacterales bacterium]